MIPCMGGGWCSVRLTCAHYWANTIGAEVSERLCKRGVEKPVPIVRIVIKPRSIGQ
jgi:hypothetical protein